MNPKVSVIISNRNDVTMLAVTVRSCIEELKPLGWGQGDIIICDNSDPEVYERLKSVIPSGYIREGKVKLIRQDFNCLFSARETAIKESKAQYVVCVDSHVIIGRNMILDLVKFMDNKKDNNTTGFAHAPVNWAHQHERSSKHDRDMSVNELGDWGAAYGKAQTITWKGMPWICRREWFLDKENGLGGYGALADHKLSWGGGDMHIGIKPWLLGFENWAVPTSPVIHIGPFPRIDIDKNPSVAKVGQDKYRLWADSGNGPHAIGFLVACYIIGGEPMMERNKDIITKKFGKFIDVKQAWSGAIALGKSEREWLLNKQKMSFEQFLESKPWNN